MYHQIRVDTRDVDYQRILWTTSESDQPSEFRLLTITYGTACAPFLALRVLKQLVDDEGRDFPLAVNVLHDQIYVDDVLFGDSDPHRLRLIRDQLRELLQCGGFELRKWASNTPSLLSDISPDNHGLACQKTLQPDKNLKVLGIGWSSASDVFRYTVSLPPVVPRSKRLILSTIAKLFDPLGWVTPVTIKAKIFLQYLWRLKLNWDDELPTEHVPKWTAIYSQLTALNKLDLPRWMGTDAHASQYEIHGFLDASSAAYAAVVYLKTISDSDQTMISLVMGKSKVAPIKPMSIPRLELAVAVLLSKLIQYVQKALQISTINSYCWTDSTVVLAWLQQHPSRWKTCVANRVHEIQSNLPTAMWRHVPTLDNPADCASRGVLGDDLTHALWWNGPPWLKLSCDHWPPPTCATQSDSEVEQKVTSHSAHPKFDWDLQAKFSSWHTLIRVTAYVMRFVTLCRRKTDPFTPRQTTGIALHADECQAARVFWFRHIQTDVFLKELTALRNQSQLSPKSSIAALHPFLDKEGLLRVGGRLKNAPLPFKRKYPILLASHPLVTRLVRTTHIRSLHAGLQLTLAKLRQEFWILRARTLVKSVIYQCVTCTREKAASPLQLMGDLPSPRVTPSSRSFLHCGLDYAGPVQIRI
ncbi:PREDICTED: uncharacterized protein LOC105569200 [Vollenhovia emeryi]|uniref:uncharacterized protein LOC105569200 n=1 Tax=Vollenhovia emeryi TaxID=411798 RepID=UPI0005F5577D|nr:PREDICTED: uncharacterized protein LOC105569200 [Vollenhovia emeryi]